jgi:hypothetical protein
MKDQHTPGPPIFPAAGTLVDAIPDMLTLLRKAVDENTRYGKVSLGTVTDMRWLLEKLDGAVA